MQIDISQRLDSALLPFGIIVVGLSIVLLTAVFRSILVPIKAALGYLLSLLAGMGASVAVFQWGWGAEFVDYDNNGRLDLYAVNGFLSGPIKDDL